MKTIKYIFIAILATCFIACNDDDTFSGDDNYITQFTLKQGDKEYEGLFEENRIVVYFDNEAYNKTPQATIKLSENARISPNPKDIDNWFVDQQFVVTSHNGTRRVYLYSPQFKGVSHSGDVILKTQEDVDTFAKLGITHITGNLIIANSTGNDSISSVTALNTLKKVDYNLTINACYKGETLVLEGLEEVGNFASNTASKLTQITLPNLKKVYLSASFGSLYELVCPNLETVGKDLSVSNYSYTYCALTFPNLKKVDGTLNIGNNSYRINSFSLPKLESAGSVKLSFMANNIALPALKTVEKELNISDAAILLIDLPLLQRSETTTLSGKNIIKINAPKLEQTGNLTFSNNQMLSDFSLPTLKTAKKITITRNTNLQNVDLSGLKTVDEVRFENITNINAKIGSEGAEIAYITLSYVDNINIIGKGKITNTLSTAYGIKYCKISGIKEMKTISSYLSTVHMEFPDLEHVTGIMQLAYRDEGKILIPNLKKVDGAMTFMFYSTEVPKDTDIDIKQLETVGEKLSISGNNNDLKLTHLNMFSSIRSAQSVEVLNLKKLVDFNGLKNIIPSIPAANWKATGNAYNPTYQDLLDGKWTN